MLTFDQIKELIELVARRGLATLEVERSGFRLKIDGKPSPAAPGAPAPAASPELATPEPAAVAAESAQGASAPAVVAPAAVEPVPKADALAGAHIIQSPIVGTFYRSPAPDADPFVEVGDRVKRGQVLCIVEAMKIMNEIESEVDGVVLEVYPKNAQPVEFGERLFALRTS